MKAQRRQSMRARPHLADREPRGVPGQFLAGLLKRVQREREYSRHLRQGPAQPGFRKIADVLPAQFFVSAFLRCRFSDMLPPPWLNVPVIAEASLLSVPS